jgi:hypothetical protein
LAKSAKGGSWPLTDANMRGCLIAGDDMTGYLFRCTLKFMSMQAKFEKFYSPRPHPENIKFSLLKFDVIFVFVLMGLNCAMLGGSSLLLLAGCLKQ